MLVHVFAPSCVTFGKLVASDVPAGRLPRLAGQQVCLGEAGPHGQRRADPPGLGGLLPDLQTAGQPMRAMILLAADCGLGNSDVRGLEFRHVDLENGWLD